MIPSLLFFRMADPRLSARRRLREWLVLLLRVLALAAFMLALARPTRQGWGGGDVFATIVMDNSASMAAVDDEGQTRFSRGLAAANAVLQDPAIRQAGIITTVCDPVVGLPSGFSGDLAGVSAALGAVRITHASGDVTGALRQAAERSRGVLRGSVEVHVFTDLQAAEWGRVLAPVAFARGTTVVLHDVGRSRDHAGVVAAALLLLPQTELLGLARQRTVRHTDPGPFSLGKIEMPDLAL